MKVALLLITATLFIGCNSVGTDNYDNYENKSMISQLNRSDITEIQVHYYESLIASVPFQEKEISDQTTIEKVVELLGTLPSKGDIMIRWSNEALKTKIVLLDSKGNTDTIIMINGMVQTSDTSFFNPVREEEIELWELLESLKHVTI
ncbi:hypothetical protein QA601_11250 [Chitinispirillales bacterium ANBcel5]|uniref:hypothetical protein n=1 Tax=Cellulosispirillum alkaliphilum TaxID=3039283 RepID=UPI002A4FA1C6|nr:hypothetical protein [Chitinispirillales bacterium ANBcel5]